MSDSSDVRSAIEGLLESLSKRPAPIRHCDKCGSTMIQAEATFFSDGGKVWTIPLPACPICDVKDDAVAYVPPAEA